MDWTSRQFVREQAEFQFLVEIFGDDLRIVVDLKITFLPSRMMGTP